MLNIIKADLFRIFKSKAIYIIIFILIVLNALSAFTMSAGNVGVNTSGSDQREIQAMNELSEMPSLSEYREVVRSLGGFPLDKEIIAHNINLYYFFIGIVVTVLGVDFSNKSIKNTVSSAITRKKYFLSKMILITIISTILIIFNSCCVYGLNLWFNGVEFASGFGEIIKITLMQLPLLYGIMSLLVCFAFVFRKISLFNTISIPFIMIVQLIANAIVNLLRIDGNFLKYEVQNALSQLAFSSDTAFIRNCIILGIVYVIVFNILGYFSFKKAEIK